MHKAMESNDGLKQNISQRQAYLIMAHKDDLSFKALLKMLDDSRNDIFIHMDKKNLKYALKAAESCVMKSPIYHTERTKVTWGGYSQINAEILLLKKALATGKYQHYHLLSGQDLPIKKQEDIISFFSKNPDKEFVRFEKPYYAYEERTRYYHFLQEKVGRSHNVLYAIEKLLIYLQKAMHIHRNKNIKFQKGTNWFSITDEFARYVVEREDWIKKVFKYTRCCDEVFLQTLLLNSPYNLYYKEFDNDCHAIMRFIDWNRGRPYTFVRRDFDELCDSDLLFARKFDADADSEIIELIQKKFKDRNV